MFTYQNMLSTCIADSEILGENFFINQSRLRTCSPLVNLNESTCFGFINKITTINFNIVFNKQIRIVGIFFVLKFIYSNFIGSDNRIHS